MNAEEFRNLCITLINQATYMLRRLLESQQDQFLQHGGIREQMYAARTQYRTRQNINPAAGKTTSRIRLTRQTGRTCRISPTCRACCGKKGRFLVVMN